MLKLLSRTRLLKLMTISGVSQRDLAAAAGYASHTHIGRLLKGSTDRLPVDKAEAVAEYLDVPLGALFDLEGSSVTGQIDQPTVGAAS